jgi:spermidine/putrescine transport system substrate-binding protein
LLSTEKRAGVLMMRTPLIALVSVGIWLVFGLLFFAALRWSETIRYTQQEVVVCAWADTLDPRMLAEFEAETGIKVKISSYASNEELIAKLMATNGRGYDLIMPSDYAVEILIKHDLLHCLDKSRLSFIDTLDPSLCGHAYDRAAAFALPYEWEVTGLGIDRDYFGKIGIAIDALSWWDLLFVDPKKWAPAGTDIRLIMVNDAVEATCLALWYLTKQLHISSGDDYTRIAELLREQRKWVAAYTSTRPDYYLLTQTSRIAVATSAGFLRAIRQNATLDFLVPLDGTFVTIEHFALSKRATHLDAAYAFLNFIYKQKYQQELFVKLGQLPARADGLQGLALSASERRIVKACKWALKSPLFFRHVGQECSVQDIWAHTKA